MNLYQKIILLYSLLLLAGAVGLLLGIIGGLQFFVSFIIASVITLIILYIISLFNVPKHLQPEIKVNPTLYSTRSVFPLQFFPDLYIVQEKNIYIIRKTFFFSGWTEMVPVKDIASVRMYTGPFFSSLSILRKVIPQTSLEIKDLWKKDAIRMKEMIDGLIIKENKLVDVQENITVEGKKRTIFELGREREVEKEI